MKVNKMFRKYSPQLVLFYLLALLIVYGLKYHYSHAGSDDLIWVLRPTAFLIESISNIHFEREINTGFVNCDHRIIIAPACAGINFMIIVFCLSAFSGLDKMKGSRYKHLWLGISIVFAYFYTLLVNAIRIIISIHSYETGLFQSLLTAESIHRLEGILIYFICLYVFYVLLGKVIDLIRRRKFKEKCSEIKKISYKKVFITGLIPVFWYCSVSLGIPFLNRAYQSEGIEFIKHSAIVLTVCLLVFMIFFIIIVSCQGLLIKIKYRRGYYP